MVSFPPALFAFLALCISSESVSAARSWADASSMAKTTIANLTQAEKIGLLTGLGQFHTGCIGDTHAVAPRAGILPENGIPSICMQDGPAGIRLSSGVTGFPSGINAASTFSRRLIRARGVALGEEFHGQGINMFLGPAMDIMRNPKAGRNWESAGPDPYLTGEFAYETIQGVQSTGVMACAKHYLANNQEHWRYGLTSDFLDDRTLREIYWYPFLRSIEADVSSVMCAYNRLNGTSSCRNEPLLSMLRDGAAEGTAFKGFIVSDWLATHDSAEENANAGLDMEQPGDYLVIGGGVWGTDGGGLKDAIQDGKVSIDRLDEMASHVLSPWFRLEHDQKYPIPNFENNVHTDGHVALVREIAAASTVLLKNNRSNTGSGGAGSGTTIRGLPLAQSRIKSIAVIGQDAAPPNMNCNDLGECNDGTMSVGWGSGTNSLEYIVPPITAIGDFVGNSATISQSLSNDLNNGKDAAKGKDVAIVFANADSGELGFYDLVVGNMGDRNDLDLWWWGGSLIEGVASVNNNTIVVIHSVGPVVMPWSNHPNITAIIYAGAPGEQTGPALVDVLWGARNPSGRLPFSIADDEDHYGTEIVYNSFTGFPTLVYDEKLLLDYHYMDSQSIVPRFEFGYGLSYTTFSYSSLSITTLSPSSSVASTTTSKASGIKVSFTVTNTGAVAGIEIPQVYLDFPPSAGEPPKLLRGFDEVSLEPGQSKNVTMNLGGRDMSIWDTISQTWARPSGTFKVNVGASSTDIRLSGSA